MRQKNMYTTTTTVQISRSPNDFIKNDKDSISKNQ